MASYNRIFRFCFCFSLFALFRFTLSLLRLDITVLDDLALKKKVIRYTKKEPKYTQSNEKRLRLFVSPTRRTLMFLDYFFKLYYKHAT